MTRAAWRRNYAVAVAQIRMLRIRIDALGDEATSITRDDRADQLACYASNSLEGTLAILRELEQFTAPAKRKAKKAA